MPDLFDTYRRIITQGFMPIFTEDGFDSRTQVEGCVRAGLRVIEYTLRKRDAREMIPWIRKAYPDLTLLVGSTLDSDDLVRKLRPRHPQLMTIDEIASHGVAGFVSQLRWSEASIRKWSPTHMVLPNAATWNEALDQILAGAQMIKINGPDLTLAKKCRAEASFGYCPMFVTGGQNLDAIPTTIGVGAVCVATGFDLTLKGRRQVNADEVAHVVRQYVDVTAAARQKAFPELMANLDADRATFLASLPHIHPF